MAEHRFAAGLFAVALFAGGTVHAHTSTKAQVWINLVDNGDVTVRFELEEKDVLELFDVDMSSPKEEALFLGVVSEGLPPVFRVEGDGEDCGLKVTGTERRGTRTIRVQMGGRCRHLPTETTVHYGVSNLTALDVLGLVTLTAPGEIRHVDILSRDRNEWTVVTKSPSVLTTIYSFIGRGIEHIGTGWDHLAFLLGLLLGCASLRRVLVMVTSFTLAHSVTLALGALDVVRLSGDVVEPIIAASIVAVAVFVALQQTRGRLSHPGADPQDDQRTHQAVVAVAFLFGLIHGLGFAGFLSDALQTTSTVWAPLLGFNIGVEVGQVLVVALLFPLLWVAGRTRRGGTVMLALALALAALGSYWTIDRLLG